MLRIIKIIFQIILAIPVLIIVFLVIGWFSFFKLSDTNVLGSWHPKIYTMDNINGSLVMLSDGSMELSFGCNSIDGKFRVKDAKIVLDQIVSTKIACGDVSVLEEQFQKLYLKDLNKKTEYTAVSGRRIGKYMILWGHGMVFLFTKA